jgi:hypothetical protein
MSDTPQLGRVGLGTSRKGVSLSRPLAREAPRHPPSCRDTGETLPETPDLKALARLVLARDIRRDSNRDRVSRSPHAAELPAKQSVSVSCETTESETAAETPAVSAPPNLTSQQGVRGVSLSRVLGSETPEAPQPKRVSIETVGPQDGADEEIAPIVPSWGEAEEGGAAIAEYPSDIRRAWAEAFARLDPDRPPVDVPRKRWEQFVDDVGLFLASPFCAVAAALGWGSHDLFGCDRDRPFARIDQAGLLWLLNGDKLIALTENTATIETPTGARQTYRRKPAEFGRVLAWELAE